MSTSEEIKIMRDAILKSSREHKEKQQEIQRRVEAGELPRFMPTLAADPNKETCHWKLLYSFEDRTSFDTACGLYATWGGRPMLGLHKCGSCGSCGRKVICSDDYVKIWKESHPNHEWKTWEEEDNNAKKI